MRSASLIFVALVSIGLLQEDLPPEPPASPEAQEPTEVSVIHINGTSLSVNGKPVPDSGAIEELVSARNVRVTASDNTTAEFLDQVLRDIREKGLEVTAVAQRVRQKALKAHTTRNLPIERVDLGSLISEGLPEQWKAQGVTGITVSDETVTLVGTREGVQQVGDMLIESGRAAETARKTAQWQVLRLQNAQATDVESVITRLMPDVELVAEPRINGLLIDASDNELKQIQELVNLIDSAPETDQSVAPTIRPNSQSAQSIQALVRSGRMAEARALAARVAESASQAATSSDPTQRDTLTELVTEDFEVRQQLQLAEIEFLRQKLESLERRVRQQDAVKSRLIERRVRNLLKSPGKSTRQNTRSQSQVGGPAPPNAPLAPPRPVQPGDTLGVFIPHVLGQPDESPPVNRDPLGQRPPSLGYPIQVQADGSISLPIVGRVPVAGKSLPQVEDTLRVELRNVLKDTATILVSMVRRVDDPVPPLSASQNTMPAASNLVTQATDPLAKTIRSASDFARAFGDLNDQIANEQNKISAYGGPTAAAAKTSVSRLERLNVQNDTLQNELQLQLELIRSSLEAAMADAESAKEEYSRTNKLVKSGYTTSTELSRAKAALVRAESRIRQLDGILELYRTVAPAKKARTSETESATEATTRQPK